ncbi:restriction endonuclease subunit S [Salmonella enterica]|uniref:Restriction endonuclease subunit S n=2 Tax=Salmonella enterica I TaxID=59201 RepID=A0A5U3FU30_SALET|nr:restriction endonuclease subunit S [Salmonella enterica]EBH8907260.1 restriction endonuclease subunit S [Salmonella enterica subsp. enterica serovar Santiago]EBH9883486.1 restriction endonuclease subunit S [Salmonella enterica subsp. enterica serovar Kisarawe]EBP4056903.1 restriction endonuclease subunit S [Salmonella enterica subsp. enterica]EBQ5830072.1 restriction endonuclease subunit S [Salmonella enterica subsp. enterica serovar Gatuni]EBX0571957.1 restriction endonuclease subunit S [S
MGSKWIKYRLGDIATFSYGKMPKKELIGLGKYVVFSGYKYTDSYPEKNLSVGDLIVVARGVGGTGDVKIANQDCYLTNLSIKIDLDDKIIRKEYFYYLFKQNTLRYLDSGSAQSQITINDLSNIEVVAPLPEVQDSIIERLRNLDKKIVINTSINQTLEQMSQTLFKSWFVDFDPVIDNALDAGNPIPEALQSRAELRQKVRNSADFKPLPTDVHALFPAEFEETELGWVPKGWEIGKLQDLLILQRGFDLPSTQRNIGLHPIIAASGYTGTHDIAMVKAPGVVTGRSGVLGNVFLILEDFWPLNTTLWVKELKHATPCYGYEVLKMIDFSSFNGGSAVPTLNRNHIHNLDYLLPPRNLIEKFELFSMSLHRRVHEFQKQTQTLISLRDTLLPKLISGELSLEDLPDLANQTEPA